jgi:YegS/Rv2252/BmrU family lipid kinase
MKLLPQVERELNARSIAYRIVQTRGMDHAADETRRAMEAEEIPVVMSGDGLVGHVGGVLAETATPMGIIPGGRGNDLARVLGIPREPAGAVAVLASGHEREIDVGEANGRRFLCIASFGFDSECNRIANETKLIKGNLVYAYSVPRVLAAWRPARFEIDIDGREPIAFSGWSVAIANSQAFGGGMYVAPHAVLDDGLFDIVTIDSTISKLKYLSNLPKVFKGTHVDGEGVTELHAAGSTVQVSADRDFGVYADGEHITDLPATLRVLPRALRVIAPPSGKRP